MKKWTHPQHKPLKGKAYDMPVTGLLSDRAINRYILAGKYGDDLRDKLLERQCKPKHTKSLPPEVKAIIADFL